MGEGTYSEQAAVFGNIIHEHQHQRAMVILCAWRMAHGAWLQRTSLFRLVSYKSYRARVNCIIDRRSEEHMYIMAGRQGKAFPRRELCVRGIVRGDDS